MVQTHSEDLRKLLEAVLHQKKKKKRSKLKKEEDTGFSGQGQTHGPSPDEGPRKTQDSCTSGLENHQSFQRQKDLLR